MLDDLLVGHPVKQVEVELAVANMRGEVLYVKRLFFREAYRAQLGHSFGEHLFRRWKIHVGKQTDEAAVDCVGGCTRELLENDRARECLETLAPRLNSQRTDLG